MKNIKVIICVTLSLMFLLGLAGCGSSGSEGLNGGMVVTATADGPNITGTIKFTSPASSNYIGVPVSLFVQVGSSSPYKVADANFGPSGELTYNIKPDPFNGSQYITVIATSDKVSGSASVQMDGVTMSISPPAAITQTTTAASGTAIDVVIPAFTGFINITDPFSNAEHTVIIAAAVNSTSGTATLTPTTTTTVWSGASLSSPATVVHMTVPALSATETATINWTVTDTTSGLVRTGSTIVTLTKSS